MVGKRFNMYNIPRTKKIDKWKILQIQKKNLFTENSHGAGIKSQ